MMLMLATLRVACLSPLGDHTEMKLLNFYINKYKNYSSSEADGSAHR